MRAAFDRGADADWWGPGAPDTCDRGADEPEQGLAAGYGRAREALTSHPRPGLCWLPARALTWPRPASGSLC